MEKTPPKAPPGEPAKKVLWSNVSTLMAYYWNDINLNRLARVAKIGVASAQRIKEQDTSVGLDIIDKVARAFGLHAWQLLLPDLDPENAPVTMISDAQKRLFDRLKRARAILQDEPHPTPEKATAGR